MVQHTQSHNIEEHEYVRPGEIQTNIHLEKQPQTKISFKPSTLALSQRSFHVAHEDPKQPYKTGNNTNHNVVTPASPSISPVDNIHQTTPLRILSNRQIQN